MPDLKRIQLPSGSTYDLVDQGARDLIAALEGATAWLGVTVTPLSDGSTTNPIVIDEKYVTAKQGSMCAYGRKEFVFNGTTWQEFGDLSTLGTLAYKDTASGSYTPAGTVSAPEIDVILTGNRNVTPIDSVGTLPEFTATVANETLTLGWSAGTLPTKGAAFTVLENASATASASIFTGTAATIEVE